jgi:DNA-directed RNA polymerase specialized sigma subunit
MSLSQEKIDLAKKITITYVTDYLACELNIESEEALRQFAQTKTYALLQSNKSFLYTESNEYVIDMLQSEMDGNWEEWLKI